MPLPILAVLAIGAVAGSAAAKGTSAIRRWMNDGETVNVNCRRCGNGGPHVFVTIDRSWAGGAALGMLTGAIGGTVAGAVAKRVFACKSCGAAMYEGGDAPDWNADEALDAFFRYPSLKDACEELQSLVARNQAVAKKHAAQIEKLESELQSAQADKAKLEHRIRALIAQIKRDVAAA